MSEIEMLDKKINTLNQESLTEQRKLMLLRDRCHNDDNNEEIKYMTQTIKSLQEAITHFTRQKNALIQSARLK